MELSCLKPAAGSVKTQKKRLGRGQGSGKGGTSTKGHKGAQCNSGYSKKVGFEGGQMPLQRRLPKFGFKNPFRVEYKAVNLDVLEAFAKKTGMTTLDVECMATAGMVARKDLVKVLGKGELTQKLDIKAHAFSKSAQQAIEALQGTVEIL